VTGRLAAHGGSPIRTEPWPAWPIADDQSAKAVSQVIESGAWFRVDGTHVSAFEQQFAEFQHARFCTTTPNGTLALDAALRAIGVSYGDEVIVPPYTFIATAMAVVYVGAIPVFADIDPVSGLLDPAAVSAAITARTKAIVPVHLSGSPCDMDALLAVASQHGLRVIEDAAQAHGAEWRGQRVGALGDIGAFSFQNGKNISAGEGGALVTNDEALADRIFSLCNVGRIRGGGWYEHAAVGYNLRMTELQAAVLEVQLQLHEQRQSVRERNAALLTDLLDQIDGVQALSVDERVTAHGRHGFLVRVKAAAGLKQRFVDALAAEGIPIGGGYPGLHTMPALADAIRRNTEFAGATYLPRSCPGTDEISSDALVLTQSQLLADERAMRDIAAAIEKVLAHRDEL
jgi:dTDP-4-amino-4,6-dideoxygalactose transaminase